MGSMEDSNAKGSGYYLFGRDIMAIPCFRDSALAGFASAFGVGIIHFLLTSHGQKSMQYAQFAFLGVMFPYVFICQDRRYANQLMVIETQETMKARENDDFLLTDSLEFTPETWG